MSNGSARPFATRRRISTKWATYLFLAPAALFVLISVVYPIVYNVEQSFHEVGIAQLISGTAEWVGFDNYASQFADPGFWSALGVSLLYTGCSVGLAFVIAMGLALLFNRTFPGRTVMRSLLVLAWILPTVVTATLWRWMLDGSYGLVNFVAVSLGLIDQNVVWLGEPVSALIAVTIATSWGFAPFGMLLLLAGLQSIPGDLYEAARIDGASRLQQFTAVTLPVLRPVSLVVVLLIFINTFKAFDTVYLMTRGGPGGATKTLPIHAYQEAFTFHRYGEGAAATVILLLVPLVLSVFYFRSLRKEAQS